MTMTIASTTKTVTLDGVLCRIWEGSTERGVKVHCFIPRVAVAPEDASEEAMAQFEQELAEQRPPSPVIDATYPLRMIL